MLYTWLDPNDEDNVNRVPNLPTPEEIRQRAAEIRQVNLQNKKLENYQDDARSIQMKICPRCKQYRNKKRFCGTRCDTCHKRIQAAQRRVQHEAT